MASSAEGKIVDVDFVAGGKHESEIGFRISFETNIGNFIYFQSFWNSDYECNERERVIAYYEMIKAIDILLKDGNVNSIKKLVNAPVRCHIGSDDRVKSFEILKNVLLPHHE